MEEKEGLRGYFTRGEEEQGPQPLKARSQGQPEADRELMRRAQSGDQGAISALYTGYRRKVLNYVYRFTGNRASAEELTQETFLKVFQNLHRYRPTGSVAGWIYRIAGNLSLNALRSRRQAHEISLDEPLTLGDETSVDRQEAIATPGLSPAEEAVHSEQEDAVQRSLMKISPRYREVVILCDIEGYPYREVAEMLHVPINTVASRLARGRAQLAELLGYLKTEEGKSS